MSELAFDESNAYYIMNSNGVYLIANKLFDNKKQNIKDVRNLQCNALRALRILYSIERKQFYLRKILPMKLFEQFVSIGDFKKDLKSYKLLLGSMNGLSVNTFFLSANLIKFNKTKLLLKTMELEINKLQIKSINLNQAPSFYVNEFAVFECIGKGMI